MRVGLVVPHIFMQWEILPHVIFSPGQLALSLADVLSQQGATVTLFTPGPVPVNCQNITADRNYFEAELARRGDSYIDLLKKHPFTFITLARQLQAELIAQAYQQANDGQLDIVHIYTNEEETALPFAGMCTKPVVFTHHDPFNFMVKYKNFFPKYNHLNWISMSLAQRSGMPSDTNWVANIYHGLTNEALQPAANPTNDYVAYIGRIIQPKGVHLAIMAVLSYNQLHPNRPLRLTIAGKHYAGHAKDGYWQKSVLPHLDNPAISYIGHIADDQAKQLFLANAVAVLVPSLFDEPFGMVTIEALACGTPVIGLDSGAIPEVIKDGQTGFVVAKQYDAAGGIDDTATAEQLAATLPRASTIDRIACRADYEQRFTAERMSAEHYQLYARLIQSPNQS